MTRTAIVLGAFLLVVLAAPRLRAQDGEVDPCASTRTTGELKNCWAREVSRADDELRQAFDALVATLPGQAADDMRKAQKLWTQYRDQHVRALYGGRVHDSERFTCALIAQRQLTVRRTAELREMLQRRDGDDACPL